MKKYFVLAAIVIALMSAGVIHFQKDGDEVNISIDRGKLRKVSGELIEEGKDLINNARDDFKDAGDQASDFRDAWESEDRRSQSRRFTPSRSR